VLDSPEEDAPRRVYADWEEEYGDPRRAEFIRLGLELAALPAYAPRALTLGERLRLWDTGGWDREVTSLVKGLRYRRGFIEGVVFESVTDFLKVADRLFELAPVRQVDIRQPWARSARWGRCPHLARLRALTLGGEDAVRRWGARSLANALGPEALAGLSALDLYDNYLGGELAEVLASLSHLRNLAALDLSGNHLGERGVETLTRAPHLLGLKKLDLGSNSIRDGGLAALAGSAFLPGLRELGLGGSFIDDLSNELTSVGIRALTHSPRRSSLHVLDLYFNYLGDRGAAELSAWPGLACLADLNLGSNGLTDDGLKALAASPHLAGLVRLGIAGNRALTEAGVRALLASPGLANLAGFRLYTDGAAFTERLQEELQDRFGEGLEDF
jgi:uncharacterized protein (TIGR02996 family)